ncbi:MAG: hypothetical protein JJU02_06000 [Cryomorphaceae bacterium]|nr:hypothetical protein [Cryomorphaceae bacterium]
MTKSLTFKKILKTITAILILLLLFIGLKVILEVDYEETIKTKYSKTDNRNIQIIETDFFKIKTPKNWIHISSGFGIEGDPYGYFWTKEGRIHYEYGFFGPSYKIDNEIYKYGVEKRKIGRFEVNIATNNKNETGIAILPQLEMNRTMTFYMDESVTANLDALLEALEEIEFKKR